MREFRLRVSIPRFFAIHVLAWLAVASQGFSFADEPKAPVQGAKPVSATDSRRLFQDARFGLFMNWGLYSLLGKDALVMENDKLPITEYEKLPPRFNPTEFDAEGWVKTAKAAGMKYLTVTAKHHDGFSMFDSKLTRYDIVDATPFAKDPLKSLAEACRKHGLLIFFYYSLLDWHHADYTPLGRTGNWAGREAKGNWSNYIAFYQGQIRELCSNYGAIGGIWLDGAWDRPDANWDLEATYRLIHLLQPGALIGNNHHSLLKAAEDFQVFEHDFPGENKSGLNPQKPDVSVPWELRETINASWNFNPLDRSYKSATELISLLVNAAGRNANLLLTVNARDNGSIAKEAIDRLGEVGKWLDNHGESIYATRQGPVPPQRWIVSTQKPTISTPAIIYLHIFNQDGEIRLPETALSYDAHILGSTKHLPLSKDGKQVVLEIPVEERSQIDTIVVLTLKVLDPALREQRLQR